MRKPGRPPADEVHEGAAKQVMDAKKIVLDENDSTAQILERANSVLETTAKASLLQTAVANAKKAEIMSRRELKELQDEEKTGTAPPIPRMGGGMSAEDIRTIAETLPESQREAFIRQAMGMSAAANGGNPMMSAWFQSKANGQQQPASNIGSQPMSLTDTIQAMMGMMMMQNQMQQQRAAEWREQQEYLEQQHQRRLEELREARGDVKREGPNPEVEALKLQLEFYRDTLKENQTVIKELTAARQNPTSEDSDLRKEIMALTQKNLEDQKLALQEKIQVLESKIGDVGRFNLNIHEMVKKANESGANLRMGDTTDLQLTNEHEFRMKTLEKESEREEREYNMRMADANARAEAAKAQQDAIKMIVTEVGSAIIQSKVAPPQPLAKSSKNVQSIVGAAQ